jgi:hypothetical protein
MAQPTPIWAGTVRGGAVHLDTRPLFDAYAKAFEGERVELVLRNRKSQRSLDQNAWIWGVAYPLLAEGLGYDAHEHDVLHYALVEKWGGSSWDKRLRTMVPNKRSSHLTTKEFSDYMEWLVRFAAECGVIVPLPDEAEVA